MPQVELRLLAEVEYAVEMVGHHLLRYHCHLRVIAADARPLPAHRQSQRRKFHMRGIGGAFSGIALTHDAAQQRPPPLHGHRHQIETLAGIVVTVAAPLHRRHGLAGKWVFGSFLLHTFCVWLTKIQKTRDTTNKDSKKFGRTGKSA